MGRRKAGITALDRFEEKYVKTDSCWLWTAGTTGRYGWFHFTEYPGECGSGVGAHKASLYFYRGIVCAEGDEVLHSCDNGMCVNPDHLRIGTHQDNMIDMVQKGRHVMSWKKMDEDMKLRAREMRSQGMQVKDIAEHFEMSPSTMSRITAGVY